MPTWWAENAWLPSGVAHDVRITAKEGVITEVATRGRPATGDVILMGLTLPGAANAHSHAYYRALRGRTQAGNFWTWQEARQAVMRRLNPDTYLALARATFAEMALVGYTLVGEHHYIHHDPDGRPYDDPNIMGRALMQAAEEVGIRLTLLDSIYTIEGYDGSGPRPLLPAHARFSDGDPVKWYERVSALKPRKTTRIGAAIHSVLSVPPEWLAGIAEMTTETSVLQTHLAQHLGEAAATLSTRGRTPAQLLDDAGLLDERMLLVHAIHLDDSDIALIGRSGASVCLCPTSERDLGDGIARARDLADAGASLCLGTDQHAIIDPFAELRGLEVNERLRTNERLQFSLDELVAASSAHGYDALGWAGGGRIAVGAPADLATITLESVRTMGSKPAHAPMIAMG